MIEPPEGLLQEVVELYQKHKDTCSAETIFVYLNSPWRIRDRGYKVTPAHLLALVIDQWRIKPNSRFLVYDDDLDMIIGDELFHERESAVDYAEECGGDARVLRVDL